MEIDQVIKSLQALEPKFLEAGKLAMSLRSHKKDIIQKFKSGVHEVDIVTEADLEVQRFLLQQIVKTELVDCRLLAEEETSLKDKFNHCGDFVLTLDPIDGTVNYASNSPFYGTIIGLHDKKRPLYTFKYYPEIDYKIQIVGCHCTIQGEEPTVNLLTDEKKVIVYTYGNPKKALGELYDKLISEGYVFRLKKDVAVGIGATTLFMFGKTEGYYNEVPNVYDGLVGYHYALSQNYRMLEKLNLGKTVLTDKGLCYPGYFLAISK